MVTMTLILTAQVLSVHCDDDADKLREPINAAERTIDRGPNLQDLIAQNWHFGRSARPSWAVISEYKGIEVGKRVDETDAREYALKMQKRLTTLDRADGGKGWRLNQGLGGNIFWSYTGKDGREIDVSGRYDREDFEKAIDYRTKLQSSIVASEAGSDASQWKPIELGKGKLRWEYQLNQIGPTFDNDDYLNFLKYREDITTRLMKIKRAEIGSKKQVADFHLSRVEMGRDKGKLFFTNESEGGHEITKRREMKDFSKLLDDLEKYVKVRSANPKLGDDDEKSPLGGDERDSGLPKDEP